jgi:hypothetical protein
VVQRAAEILAREPGFVAAWVGGSLAAGVADVFSDVDLNVVTEDQHLDDWGAAWPAVIERIAGPLVLAQAISAPVVGGFGMTQE